MQTNDIKVNGELVNVGVNGDFKNNVLYQANNTEYYITKIGIHETDFDKVYLYQCLTSCMQDCYYIITDEDEVVAPIEAISKVQAFKQFADVIENR